MRICPLCSKKPMTAVTRRLLRGNYNPTGKKKKYPNLQWANVSGKRMKICTTCIKTMYKT